MQASGRSLSWLRSLILTIVAVTSFRSAIADWNDVPTGSMKPTILEGDRVYVNKLAYDLKVPFTQVRLATWGAPQRGDIVVFYSPADGIRLIKRVVGMPGDKLQLVDNVLLVNGKRAAYSRDVALASKDFWSEDHAQHYAELESLGKMRHPIILQQGYEGPRASFGPVVVPADHYFMMGDNRDNSLDSRWFGFVDKEAIVGRAEAVALSVNPSEHYLPRWQRFFSKLL